MKGGNLERDFPVIHDRPPIFGEIVKVIPRAADPGVVFAYHPAVYVPSGRALPPQLVAHERVHLEQQAGDPAGWWKRYLEDPEFRFEQEMQAHQAEYRAYCELHADRNERAVYLSMISRRLASPLYGVERSPGTLRKMIAGGR